MISSFRSWLGLAFASVLGVSNVACGSSATPAASSPADARSATLSPDAEEESDSTAAGRAREPPPPDYEPVDVSGFTDNVNHYMKFEDKFDYPRHRPKRVVEIANNLLLYQRDNGGWPANFDPLRVIKRKEARKIRSQHAKKDSTLDNASTFTEVEYLAAAYERTQRAEFRDGALRGLEYLLRAQAPSGGWPHSYPGSLKYHPHITFLDDVTIGAVAMMRKAGTRAEPFRFLDPALTERCQRSHRLGEDALLRLQVRANGKLTIWAGQYDRNTLLPTTGRSFELPSLTTSESVHVVQYLMSIENPSPEVKAAIEAAIEWFRGSVIHGLRIQRVKAKAVRHAFHTSREDRIAVADPKARPIWGRFYDLKTNRPFLTNRNGKKVYRLADVDRERRTGYGWYTPLPEKLLEKDYPKWKKRISGGASALPTDIN